MPARRAVTPQRAASPSGRGRRRWLRPLALLGLALVAADALYLAAIWPDWDALARGPAPRSAFLLAYERERTAHGWPPPLWRPVPLAAISRHMTRAAIVAEDARFWSHEGVDLVALRDALDENLERGRLAFGGSTISQQTVKNLFLTPSRSPLRKWHELVLTLAMERHLSKRRILELYLNVAELGLGVYGVEAAAQRYFGTSAAELSREQAAELAASLPSPKRSNPATRTRFFQARTRKILRILERVGDS